MANHLQTIARVSPSVAVETRRPRIAFLGVGWIGLQRLRAFVRDAVVREDLADVVGVCDPSSAAIERAGELLRILAQTLRPGFANVKAVTSLTTSLEALPEL
ncbi:MAG: hypothetical protein ACF8TS_20815 [Maioricimonas sp. JB049]